MNNLRILGPCLVQRVLPTSDQVKKVKSETFDCLLSLLIYCCQMVTLVTPTPVDGCPFAGDSPVIPSIPCLLNSNIMTLLIHHHTFDFPQRIGAMTE